MNFESTLVTGRLCRRYKRFLADVVLDNGIQITAHVPNTGSMLSTSEEGSQVALSVHAKTSRKYKYTLEYVRVSNCWVGVNTTRSNKITAEAILNGSILQLAGYDSLRMEVPFGEKSRVDMLLSREDKRCYVEVKNVTYKKGHAALFPDAVTERGTRHLRELIEMVKVGHRAVIFFLVNRSDCSYMMPAANIDPLYSKSLSLAVSQGVEAMAYK